MINFRKAGNFYSVYDDDAIILHSLFKYKIKDDRVGFPVASIDKIIDKLNMLNIDYKIDNEETHFTNNKYNFYLIEAKNRVKMYYKVEEIMKKIEKLDFNQLNELITIIDGYLNES